MIGLLSNTTHPFHNLAQNKGTLYMYICRKIKKKKNKEGLRAYMCIKCALGV